MHVKRRIQAISLAVSAKELSGKFFFAKLSEDEKFPNSVYKNQEKTKTRYVWNPCSRCKRI